MRDYDIRQLLPKTLLSKFVNDNHSKIVEELKLPVAGARIDVAVINGSLHGYEIKSAVDSLQRLPSQLEAYSKVFDYLSVVTENKHYTHLHEMLPKWVGIYVCSETLGQPVIKEIREPKLNKKKKGFYIAKLLWREEILAILDEQKITHKKKDRNWLLCETLAYNIEIEKLSELVRVKLKSRPDNWKDSPIKDYEVVGSVSV